MLGDLLVICMVISVSNAGSYEVTFPDSLIPGEELNIRVIVVKATGPVNVVASLCHSYNDSTILTSQNDVWNGIPSTLSIKVPDNIQMSQYKVLVNGSGGVSFSAESRITYVDDNLHIFIQTDKTIYSATQEGDSELSAMSDFHSGCTVKLGQFFKNKAKNVTILYYNEPFTITSQRDGKNNKIEVRENLKAKDGVITGRLQLSREPVFGTWSIDINAATKKLTKHFEVNDYAIPRFSVDIALPKEIPYQSATVNVSVKAKFTFGAKVYGNCKLQIYTKASIYNFLEYNKHMQGSVTFTVPISDISRQFSLYDTFIVRALVTDNATTLTIGTEENLWINYVYPTQRPQTTNRYLSISKLEKRDTFIPGMSYYTQIFVGYNDGPIGKSGVINVTPTVTTAEVKSCLLNNPHTKWLDLKTTTLQSFDIPFDNEGYADLSFTVAAYTDKIVLQLRYETIYKNVTLYSVSSVPVLLLRMYTNKTNVQVGQRLEIMTEASGDLDGLISYEIFARGVLRKTLISGVANEKRTKTGFEITADMIPEVYVVATHVTKAGDLLTDHLLLRVYGSPLKNKVSIQFNTTILEPKEGLRMDIKADPNSTVYIMIEDKRSRLLGTGNDVFDNEIVSMVENIASYDDDVVMLSDIPIFTKTNAMDLLMFNTNLPKQCFHITTPPPLHVTFPTWIPGMVPTPAPGAGFGSPNIIPTPAPGWLGQTTVTTEPPHIVAKEFIRLRFPETWLWDEYHVGSSGKISINQTVPDTITTWVASVFATNSISGFGISDMKQNITVKKDFFITVDMPSSIIIGEEFIVQISVFNYMTLPQTVFLQAVQSDDPNNPIPAATTVPPNEGRSTHVHVSPKHVGVLKVNVFARTGFLTTSTTDAVEKELMVMHTGVQRATNEQLLVDVNGGMTLTQTLPLVNHPDLIPGTKTVYMKISGDFLVPNTFGLERLISGLDAGAEQGLVDIAHNVILMKYLSITGQLTKAVESKAINTIRSGYQNVLAFKRGYDGSFALSGESSNYGSTWLTAFVLKSFHQARDLISVDEDVMFRAMVYLLGQQNNNGSFSESTLYTNHDKERTTLQITAYCIVTIKECGDIVNAVRLSPAITKGQQYLESQLSTITDPYTLSIVCYALAKSGSSNGTTCYKQLAASKHAEDGYVYWPESSQAIGHMKYNSQQQSSSPAKDVETAGYALLTFIALGFQAEGLPILKWLISQRNSRGGFYSTQDTVVAIQALAEYGIIQAHVTKQSGIQINAFGIGFMHSFNVTQMKYDSVHQIEMPANLQNVVIQATGEGIAVVDVAQSYYVNSSSSNGTFIAVASDFEQDSLNTLILKTIVRWNGTYVSRMILMEIEMPTGFVADHDFFIKQSKVMKHESIGRTLVVYLFGIPQNSETVVKVKLDRSEPVVKNQGGTIAVYDYNEPSQRAIARYESGVLKRDKICDVCPLCLFCTGYSAFSQIGIGK